MNYSIERIYTHDNKLIKELFKKDGMDYENVNENFFKDDKNILLVASYDNTPCGYLYGHILDLINKKDPEMFLYSIDVFPEFQRRGIGSGLIEELKKIAIDKGCFGMFVLTNDSNEKAKGLYEKCGGYRSNNDDVMYEYFLK